MAKAKYLYWLEPENLERIKNWAANGLTKAEIARSMCINPGTLSVWLNDHPEISEAIKSGRMLSCAVIENALFAKASGQTLVIEETEEFRGELKDGKPYNGTIVKKKRKKHIPPDTAAAIFYLKNRGGYSDNPNATPNETAPRFYFDPKAIK